MRKIFLYLTLFFVIFSSGSCGILKKNKKKSEPKANTAVSAFKKDSVSSIEKIVKDGKKQVGLFTAHFIGKTNKLYFEIPDSAFSHLYMLANRVTSISNTQDYVAGQMATSPLMIRFSRDEKNVYMHKVQHMNIVDEKDAIAASFSKNFTDPVLKGFKIEAEKGGSVLIDVTSFFGTNERSISPIKDDNPIDKLLGGSKALKGTFVADASAITEVKAFPKNIEVMSMLSYNTTPLNEPYTVHVQRSLFLLPDNPMKPRLDDSRVGFFSSDKNFYSSEKSKIDEFAYIHRWRLEPKTEDLDRYFAGELVEPQKPIEIYVDSAFPSKWKETVKQGVEDWNIAFEKAGFKNAIKAKDYPKNDPNFDPDDMRYSCVRYAVSPVANAMGPSYVDPRTGEILAANVIWYHNVVSLVHSWRFVQTAAVDPRVRTFNFSDDVMQESLRYVSAHEIGHTIGLMHNMGASYSFPVDSLRSPSFTQKYGTTPSIMDYARNNFIAQPGDYERGVRLVPPIIGVYDEYAINWGYRLIRDAKNPKDEKAELSKWIKKYESDTKLAYGAQQFFATVDPTAQTEDLGDDHIRSGNFAISNLKLIMANFEKWLQEPGDDYRDITKIYENIVSQFTRHLRHVMPYVGGVQYKEVRQGDNQPAQKYVSKKDQKAAFEWLIDQARTYNEWLTPPEFTAKIGFDASRNDRMMLSVVGSLFNGSSLYRINESGKIDPVNNYSLQGYLDDMLKELFKPTYSRKSLSNPDMAMQSAAIASMIKMSNLKTSISTTAAKSTEEAYEYVMHKDRTIQWCSVDDNCCSDAHHQHTDNGLVRINFGLPALPSTLLAPVMTARLSQIKDLYSRSINSGDKATRDFYKYQLMLLNNLFSPSVK